MKKLGRLIVSLALVCVLLVGVLDPLAASNIITETVTESGKETVSSTASETQSAVDMTAPSSSGEGLETSESVDKAGETVEMVDLAKTGEADGLISQALLARAPAPSNFRISVNGLQYKSFEEALEKANDGDLLMVSGGPVEIAKTIDIPAGKHLTLDLGGQTLTAALDTSSHNLFYISGEGSFTLKNGTLIGKDKDGDGYTGRAVYAFGVNLTLDSIEASGFTTSDRGGVVQVHEEGKAVQISLVNNHFHNNSAQSSGGAVLIRTSQQETKTVLTNNIIRDNQVSSSGYAWGGGISFAGKGVLELKGNTISGNQSSVSDTIYDLHWSHGGGISIDSNFNSKDKNLHVVMEDNRISDNKTQLLGGGIYFFLDEKNGDLVDLRSGIFSANHSGYAGGAIDYSVHGQPTLVLKNFLMTGNKAPAGGAIWACPTVHMDSYSTLGGAVLGNELIESIEDTNYKNSGHDIQFEGSDTKIPRIKDGNDPTKHKATVVDRTFLGEKINWYQDDAGNLYKEGNRPIDLKDYRERETTFGLYGKTGSSDWYDRHKEQALLIFENNTAGVRGGVISSNSPLQIGEAGDVQVKVQKQWLDRDGSPLTTDHPTAAEVQLVRRDEAGVLSPLETATLSAANNWQYLFSNLPAKGWLNGRLQKFTYAVQEVGDLKNFKVTYKEGSNPADVDYSIIIENKEQPVGSLQIVKTVDGPHLSAYKTEKFKFKLHLNDKQINGSYGDLQFINGESTFELSHGESKLAEGLPAGVEYSVEEIIGTAGRFSSKVDRAKGKIQADTVVKVHFINTPEETTTTTTSATTTSFRCPTTPQQCPTSTPGQPKPVPKTGENRSAALPTFFLVLGALVAVGLLKREKSLEL